METDKRDLYIKRMEAAVLRAGAAISKLTAENAKLKIENEQLKQKIESTDLPLKRTNRPKMRPEVTEIVASVVAAKSIGADASSSRDGGRTPVLLKPASVTTETLEPFSPPDNALAINRNNVIPAASSLWRVKPIPDVVARHAQSKSKAMCSLALGESILRTDEGKSVTLPVTTESPSNPPLEKKQASLAVKENKMQTVKIIEKGVEKEKNKTIDKSPEKTYNAEQPIFIKESKRILKTGPEEGWDTTFTAGCYSYKKYFQKTFEIKPTLSGLYSAETKKPLLPNDSVELLIANASEKNFHSVGKFLRKFSPDIISKHLNDHLRHVSHDARWLKTPIDFDSPTGRLEGTQGSKKVASDSSNYFDFLPLDLLVLIDQLVSVFVSMISRNPGDFSNGTIQGPSISALYLELFFFSFLSSYFSSNCLDFR
jgi:hypothetical protein